jgi:hypothetical protein
MRFVRDGLNRWRSYGQIITHIGKILKKKFLPVDDDVQRINIKWAGIIEHGRMSMKPRVWVIQCFQDFSKLFVRPPEDKDEQGVLPGRTSLKRIWTKKKRTFGDGLRNG